jgi:hypothetical protein
MELELRKLQAELVQTREAAAAAIAAADAGQIGVNGFQEGERSDPSEAPTAAPRTAAGYLGGAQGACKVLGRQRNALLSGIASKWEGAALDEFARKE